MKKKRLFRKEKKKVSFFTPSMLWMKYIALKPALGASLV
jgi:hypothetical protein